MKSYFAVEFPVFVENTDRAIEGLGGNIGINTSLLLPHQPKNEPFPEITLNFRRLNPCSHPIRGHVVSTSNHLLLRIRKSKSSQGNDVEYEIVGTVKKTARFRALADFQYQVPQDSLQMKLAQDLDRMDVVALDKFEFGPDFLKMGLAYPQDTSLPPPPQFSQINVPLEYNFRQNAAAVKALADNEQYQTVVGGDNENVIAETKRPVRRDLGKPPAAIVIFFSTNPDKCHIPQGLPEELIKAESNSQAVDLQVLRELFEKRPIWPRWMLLHELGSEHEQIKRRFKHLIPHVAYYFKNGPWRWTWAKYGYDPRMNPQSRMYQIIEDRNITPEDTNDVPHRYTPSQLCSKPFEGRLIHGMPISRQLRSSMALIDINEPTLQRIARLEDGLRQTCHNRDGWFSRSHINALRTVLGYVVGAFLHNEKLANLPISQYDQPENHMKELQEMSAQERSDYEQEIIGTILDANNEESGGGESDDEKRSIGPFYSTTKVGTEKTHTAGLVNPFDLLASTGGDRRRHERLLDKQVDKLMANYSATQTQKAAINFSSFYDTKDKLKNFGKENLEMEYEIFGVEDDSMSDEGSC